MGYKKHKFHLSRAQVKKLAGFKPVMLKHSQIGNGAYTLHLAPENFQKVTRALQMGKGMKLSMKHDEVEKSGSALDLKKLAKSIAKAAKPVVREGLHKGISRLGDYVEAQAAPHIGKDGAKALVKVAKKQAHKYVEKNLGEPRRAPPPAADDELGDSFLTQQGFGGGRVRPQVRKVLGDIARSLGKAAVTGAATYFGGPAALAAAPVGNMLVDRYAQKGVDALGNLTGAYGIGDTSVKRALLGMGAPGNYNNHLLGTSHPALRPNIHTVRWADGGFQQRRAGIKGGSFMTAG